MPLFAADQDIEDSKMKTFSNSRAFQAALIGISKATS